MTEAQRAKLWLQAYRNEIDELTYAIWVKRSQLAELEKRKKRVLAQIERLERAESDPLS